VLLHQRGNLSFDLGDRWVLWIQPTRKANQLSIARLRFPKGIWRRFQGSPVAPKHQDVLVVGREQRRLAVGGILRPHQFLDAILFAEHLIADLAEVIHLVVIDADEDHSILGQESSR